MSPPRRRSSGFGLTWWGRAWVRALEGRARLDANRLPRGRSYAREDRVRDLAVGPGAVTARVQGRQRTPYTVRLEVPELSDEQWDAVAGAIASRAGHAAALLAGELDPEILEDAASVGVALLPQAGELSVSCTCPDAADPCKHSAAVCYLVADVLDEDPFALFLVRGRDRRHLLAAVRAARQVVARPEVAAAPGADLDDPTAGVVARDAYARPQPAAADLWALDVTIPPERPGAPARPAVSPPAGSAVKVDELHRLATDAANRAWGLAVGSSGSGLDLTLEEDLGRLASTVLGTPSFATLADRSGVTRAELAALGIAWEQGEREGVQVTSEAWDPPEDWVDEGRRALEGRGFVTATDAAAGRRRSRRADDGAEAGPRGWRVEVDRNRVAGRGIELRVGPSGLWYRFIEERGTWQLDGPPSPDPAVLVDEL